MEKNIEIHFEQFPSPDALSVADQLLVKEARSAMASAYAEYSRFKVGAAVKLSDGTLVKGSNQENIAYPSGLCAERVALFYAGANYPNVPVETLCIVAEGDLVDKDALLSPCGGCRQVMVETEKRQQQKYRVIIVSQNGVTLIFNGASDLLPLAFGV